MSLLPLLYSNWWEDLEDPHSLLDQHFGHGINPHHLPAGRSQNRRGVPYYAAIIPRDDNLSRCPMANSARKPWLEHLHRRGQHQGGTSTVKADKDQFQVVLDVQQFAPEEITVKLDDRTVVVEAKHEEKQDEHGWISRQFTRRYMIPEQCDIEQVASKLSSDGVLSITVPRKDKPKSEGQRVIKIEHTGKPAIRENGEAKSAPAATEPQQEKK